jgi:hypothetical protein
MMPLTYSNSKKSLPIDNLYADGAFLEFYRKSNPTPLRISVQKMMVRNIGTHNAFTYKVRLYNSEPPGTIVSEGAFGPWNPKDRGSVPVHGTFHYDDANLAFFKEVSGSSFAHGTFQGDLARINVNGAADVRGFTVRGTSHKRQIAVNYKIGVDATNGDVDLTNIDAAFNRTKLSATGSIKSVEGHPGKDLSFDVSTGRARIEDLLNLFISDSRPPMTGDVAGHLKAHIPPGSDSFLRAMAVNGGFGLVRGKFVDKQTEQGLSRLSESAEKGNAAKGENPVTVLSDLKGRFTVTDGMAHLSNVKFQVPGARASLDGEYSVIDYQTKMRGLLITKGNVSAAETGMKSFLMKVLNPFFKRWRQQKVVPFKITGPYGHTHVSLDLDRRRQLKKAGIATGKSK